MLIVGETYRRTRFFDAWLNPWADRQGNGYQLIQGLIAIGSGGWLGTGLGTSRAKWDFLPNAHSDFIYAVIGEELGLLGALAVLLAFGVLIYAGVRIAMHARGTFERLLAAGVIGWIGLQAIVNMGAVTGSVADHRRAAAARLVRRDGVGGDVGGDRGLGERRARHGRRTVAVARTSRATMNVVVTGGGTAGHVFPALATATALRDLHGASIVFIGAEDGQEAHLVPDAGFRFVPVQVAAAQARLSTATVRAVALAVRGSSSCRPLVAGADVVVSIGGFASGPAALAARRTRTPLVLIEPNSVPGVVNRIAARWAAAVATTFEGTAARLPSVRVERTGNPIRREIATVRSHRDRLRTEACEAFGLERDRTTVFVFGGSQGAVHLDRVVADALPALASRGDLQLLVSAGPGNDGDLARAVDRGAALRVSVVPFIDRMDRAFALADVVVARAGASVAEITACGAAVDPRAVPVRHRESPGGERPGAGRRGRRPHGARRCVVVIHAGARHPGPRGGRSDEGRDEPSRARVGAPGRGRAHRSALRRDRGGAS